MTLLCQLTPDPFSLPASFGWGILVFLPYDIEILLTYWPARCTVALTYFEMSQQQVFLSRRVSPMAFDPPERRGKLRVLVVDDDTDTVQSTALLVQLWGHEVRTACTAAQALAEANSFQPDVALLDLAMPGMDGYRLAEQLRTQAGAWPPALVAVTGMAGEAVDVRCRQSGFMHYLLKPVDLEGLEGILCHLAGQEAPARVLLMPGAEYVSSPRNPAGRRRWRLAHLGRRAERVLLVRHSVRLAQKTRRLAAQVRDRSIGFRSQAIAGCRRAASEINRSLVLTDQLAALCGRRPLASKSR
jgi:CheY-like chemotaxis protein